MQIRNLKINSFNHIFNRGFQKSQIFKDPEDYLFFLYKIMSLIRKKNLKIYAFCLMPNHFHLLIRDQQKNTPHVMNSLQAAYAKYFNAKYRQSGHLFQGPYKNKKISSNLDFMRVKKYIMNNPLKDNLVKDLNKWPYASLNILP